MRTLPILLAFALLAAFAATVVPSSAADEPLPPPADGAVAVLELFTSQGCSSCPPADALLADLAAASDAPVIALSWHVDYWNRLGWTDPFSSSAASERQRAYAAAFRSTRVYTPQLVVNGRTEFVGHDRRKARAAIGASLSTPAPYTLPLDVRSDGDSVTVSWDTADLPSDALVTVALTQSKATVPVPRGENEGKTLSHVHVVRASTVGDAQAGSATLQRPADLGGGAVVALLQDPATLRILGAHRVLVPSP